jgi:hypothetical protein
MRPNAGADWLGARVERRPLVREVRRGHGRSPSSAARLEWGVALKVWLVIWPRLAGDIS